MKELHITDLKARMIVGVRFRTTAPDDLIPVSVSTVDPIRREVRFYSQTGGWIATCRYNDDGELCDNTGHTVHVYELRNHATL